MSKTTFSDLLGHWARPFIEALAQANIVSGFPDGSFRPNQLLNRAQYASLITGAFNLPLKRDPITFRDLSFGFWATNAIKKAYQMVFLSGYPNQEFRPHLEISKIQVLVSLVSGLNLKLPANADIQLSDFYDDWQEVPSYGVTALKTATQLGMVVNYPNLRQLQPNKALTRAEVAGLVYQALVQTGRMSPIDSPFIVPPPVPPTVSVGHRREFRGVWFTAIWNVNFPSKQGLDSATQQAELRKMLDLVQALNLNAVMWQVRPQGDALYASAREPWSAWLMGRQGKPPTPYYDPLEFFITECHKRNLEAHAWINLYRASTNVSSYSNIPPHFEALYPEAVRPYGKELWMDPGSEIAENHTYEIVMDIVQRYNIDGLHIDDYFYPYPIQGEEFPDQETYQAYQNQGGTLSLGDWRRENMNRIIRRLGEGIRAVKPHVKYGVSPFGIYRPGQPEGISGLDQYNVLYADAKKWLEEGWVDYLGPQLYWKIDQTKQSYPVLLKWWTEQNPKNIHIYIGNNLVRLTNNFWEIEEYEKQVAISRSFADQYSLGNIFYHVKPLLENWSNIQSVFRKLYPQPALPPVMEYKPTVAPPVPDSVKVVGNELVWGAKDASQVRSWTLYRFVEGSWELKTIFPATTRKTVIGSGKYALCAVNRWGRESEGVVVSV